MTTRELLQLVEDQPDYAGSLAHTVSDVCKRLAKLAGAGLIEGKQRAADYDCYRLTEDGRDLLHGASERRMSA